MKKQTSTDFLTYLFNVLTANIPEINGLTPIQAQKKIDETGIFENALPEILKDLRKDGILTREIKNGEFVAISCEDPAPVFSSPVAQTILWTNNYQKRKIETSPVTPYLISHVDTETGFFTVVALKGVPYLIHLANHPHQYKTPSTSLGGTILHGISPLSDEMENLETAKRNFAATGKGAALITHFEKRVEFARLYPWANSIHNKNEKPI